MKCNPGSGGGSAQSRVIDTHSIGLEVTTGDNTWARVTGVQETPTEVQVTVQSIALPFLPRAAIGHDVFLTVELQQPLGDRRVVDPSGQPIPPA